MLYLSCFYIMLALILLYWNLWIRLLLYYFDKILLKMVEQIWYVGRAVNKLMTLQIEIPTSSKWSEVNPGLVERSDVRCCSLLLQSYRILNIRFDTTQINKKCVRILLNLKPSMSDTIADLWIAFTEVTVPF